jgi:hypothetical protein
VALVQRRAAVSRTFGASRAWYGKKEGSPTYVMGLPGVERGLHPRDASRIIGVSDKTIMNISLLLQGYTT